ncbi:hypothetical protein Q5P01_006433 [Channa striata]|uniref:BESS domain-containing protein n=1 Tax=Channa striata TaxID=64152 RepID=A0AA88SWZ8_CHASR|nr:hypothetical protein Q5P01_006433 [Channa striata]
MGDDERLNVHISIQKGFSFPPLQKCNRCCSPAKFHCPFCLPAFFKPTKHSRLRLHLENHLRRAFFIGVKCVICVSEYTVHRCGLECRSQPHFHCLYCAATLIRKRDFTHHIPFCQNSHKSRVSQLKSPDTENIQTKALVSSSVSPGDLSSSGMEVSDETEDVNIIPDSDDQEASSSPLVAPIFGKCDQAVQTYMEKPQDCDEYYFMNLVKMFKKLSPQKKAGVRMKIERLLFEAEFE